MIVGNGLVASAFSEFAERDDFVIFASGVSNSQEKDPAAYQREFDLLKSHITSEACFVYFSTCSIADESRAHSHYIQHKKEVEEYIAENASSYVIFRLPIVVGRSSNPHTLTNFLYNSITANEPLNVYQRAIRYLIDIDDIATLLPQFLINRFAKNTVVNVAFDNGTEVTELIGMFEKVIGVEANATRLDVGTHFEIDNSIFNQFLKSIGYEFSGDYTLELIGKYYAEKK